MLAVLVCLIAWNVVLYLRFRPTRYPRDGFYLNSVIELMLLFNHLACFFSWSAPLAAIFRVLAVGWLVFGLAYVLYLRNIFFPPPPAS